VAFRAGSRFYSACYFRDIVAFQGKNTEGFCCEGTYWKARFVSKQYEYLWRDDTGLLEYERYSLQIPAIAYKGDIHEIGSIEYAYKHSGGAGSGTSSLKEKEDGYIHLGSGGGTGVMRADEVITFTIKWNGKEETLALSVKPDDQ
jgi:hypothetical protein